MGNLFGYAGRILRIDLNKGEFVIETIDEFTLKKFMGGATLGIKYLYDEYPGGHTWPVWRHDLYKFAQLLFK